MNIDYLYGEDIQYCICPECGERSPVDLADLGIGPYEYWGDKAVHSDWQQVSLCCQAEIGDDDLC